MDPRFDADVASKLQSFVEQSTDFIGVADPWGRILYLNPAACKALGVADYSDLTLADLFPTEVFSYYYEVVRPELLRTGAWSGEVRVNAADRGAVPMYISTTAQLGPGGETQGGVVLAHDLPGGVPFAAGTIDDVSGVLDRTAFRDQLGLALDASTRRGELCALVLAMIDMAPTIERFGALTATNVLRALAGRITRLTRTIDIVGRVGEHELGLVVRGIRTHNEALRIAGSVYDALIEAPVTTPSGQVSPAIACGLALAQVGDFADDIVERAAAPIFPDGADAARRFRAPAEPVEEPAPLATMDEFVVGMSRGDVHAYAAPVVELASEAVVGYQGFAQWQHPQRGLLGPEVFTALIADSPLANEVDLYVARETAAMLMLVPHEHPLRIYVAVSNRLVADIHTEQYLWEIADAFSLTMQQLCLQLDRSLLDAWTPALRDAHASLRDAGITLVATGIADTAAAALALDMGFDELHLAPDLTGAAARGLVDPIVELAHERGCRVAATGVEDDAQHAEAAAAGCDLATGPRFGAPAPTDTIE